MRPPDDNGLPVLDADALRLVSAPASLGRTAFVQCIRAAWCTTRHGRHLMLVVWTDDQGASSLGFGWPAAPSGFRALWTPAASSRIIARRFGSDDPSHWPDSFVLPLMIAKNVKNPKTGERRDRVWVLPADLWPDAASGGGATTGTDT